MAPAAANCNAFAIARLLVFFLIFDSTSTSSLLEYVHVLFSHNEPITTFWLTQDDPVTDMFPGHKMSQK